MRGNLLVRLSDCNRSAGGTEKLLMCITVAVGAEEPLAEHMMVADFFRKNDMLLQGIGSRPKD